MIDKNSIFDNLIDQRLEVNQGETPWENFAYHQKMSLLSSTDSTGASTSYTSNKKEKKINKGYNSKFTEASYSVNNTYTSFSGADAIVSIVFKGGRPITIGECQTITYSSYRPTTPVYRLGKAKPVGHTRGPRTVAGTIIFTVFDRNILVAALHKAFQDSSSNFLDYSILSDELPPFDIHITFLNEYGQSAQLIIYGAKIASEGQVMSIEDMITENTVQFLADDIRAMEPNIYEKG